MSARGRVAVVTGGADGIGRAVCVALAEAGADVASLDIDAGGNDVTAQEVSAVGGRALAVTCDVADPDAVHSAIDEVAARLGTPTILVNNAALWVDTSLTAGGYDTQVANYRRSLEVTAVGSFACAAAVVAHVRARADAGAGSGGDIVNLLTDHVHEGHHLHLPAATGYDGAKFALWRLTETWARELGPFGIRVNGLSFGATDTPMLRGVDADLARIAMRPADVARAVNNVIAQGPDGPTGRVTLFGLSRAPLEVSRAEIDAIADQT